ncbi:helix-turn-helix domain-containing protein [Bacillus mesophilum]|uniref:Helix-turn-helix transcriptional regulator n=1 Tax=Bacillus mesophilum TaxID=1071718 RepID=A0A7V7UX09_9BACI|nr:helix-turn-helix transcriptional regulator [Bacillus mesophilum]KAB2335094.1 helix-turn-helix transcriptional regulator [Bacillus mesophilum]
MPYIIIRLDKILKERNISQQEFARMTDIRQPSINDMCRNKTVRLPLDNLAKICDVLNLDITDILELKKESKE